MSTDRYLVAARKYRPQLFGEVVAQEHITETLKNAIRLGRLGHAYLFSGPRGVGKTTAARILAKAINCQTPFEERVDGAEPCRTCESCRSFEEGRSLNIIEIDGASNNKVDDIRELRDTVRIPPQGARKKVYIIDEVHMVTQQAFNALLKTLEEPPPYALFIFATTEPHKVIPTILSRCQRFDFRRIPTDEMVTHLAHIAGSEEVTADDGSLMLIARKGDGALRDALSVFEQAVSLCGSNLRYADLAQALGVVDVDLFFDVTRCVREHSSAGMIRISEAVSRAGYSIPDFLGGLAEHLRNLLVAVTLKETSLIEAAETTRERYAAEATHFGEPYLLRLLTVLAEAESAVKESSQPRLRLELALLRMAALADTIDIRTVLRRIEHLEKHGALPVSTAVPATVPPPRVAPEPQPPSNRTELPEPEIEEPVKVAEPPAPFTERKTPPPASPPKPPAPEPSRTDALRTRLFGKPALAMARRSDGEQGEGDEPSSSLAAIAGAGPETAVLEVVSVDSSELEGITTSWGELIGTIQQERVGLYAFMKNAMPLALAGSALRVSVPDSFTSDKLAADQKYLLGHLVKAIGRPIDRFEFVVQEKASDRPSPETASAPDPYDNFQRLQKESPLVQTIIQQFGGEPVL